MGETLAQTLIEATGLPEKSLEKEFNALLAKHGKTPETMTLDDLREVMADYLQTVFLELHNEDLSA